MDKEIVRTICYLARLEIDEDKAQKIEKDLETIIELIGGLSSIDTTNIEPLYSPLEKTALKHEDILDSDNQKQKFLQNAPNANDDYFLVPRVVE
ncbi:MAG: glutamyl-tRNA amidotransferase [SAR86 cluster bacterium BACL1 MAG-120920-bin57]|jgi:aspartyl-tRNA(Asn)/glutamyl-tRNA(Gln) amidotransferase subunit C|uniref:Aspartyl/glutamyl-tRNA(Asn/Gln) amidotransferase subunit C n=2 Tax=SAR86 cluster TaxID=62672 RepID=A0A0R2UA82_9GAMM|nr:MAG: glutamyl-tRNA amidotransferase [SAR86 cluster bacterium BACL1 MAG-120507-bin14]KRO40606.1 MAG: glutamyl-tRNA amidotransferase [SAR86 cluster bacterium BACL1 MAG-120920-bin57]KRO96433.1 MAG: glutamyl-tRNA amidotransferase [SAR86 cluster bacterium BACL1 MAG-120820-bin45]KRO98822.1 MAG: glutamyl-tRNA amidotransferase [SAR86 cluster bacterium BACL1 MAG-120823-bin87]KRP01699.1 MAG: glutamyl-tRNA amidotransferase [SAR86 cluster bacterium BACL1 MAG-120924-bin88]KRP03362.1 MAG: glutamyl-tRNA a